MRPTTKSISNFSRAIHAKAHTLRPDDEGQLHEILSIKHHELLARGNGLSYSDCCINQKGTVIETSRLNHMLSFDENTGIVVCQGAVTFADLFLLNPSFIPPVIPGTLHATLAGGIANDVHGKNNPYAVTLGEHIEWFDLQIQDQHLHCSPRQNSELFYATIAGLGLTGVITRLALRLRKASAMVTKHTEKFTTLSPLFDYMRKEGLQYDYQVAWLDLLNQPRAILSLANHTAAHSPPHLPLVHRYKVPKLPVPIINRTLMKQFNRLYYRKAALELQIMPLWQFNNPLDAISNWNYGYGKKGLLQFQAVFDAKQASSIVDQLIDLIRTYGATPTLAVLKYFTEAGPGLLSFAEPGFTLAIDFIHNEQARHAITKMNQLITTSKGKIYLAKDLLLNREQFITMYPKHEEFSYILSTYKSPMHSSLAKRLMIK